MSIHRYGVVGVTFEGRQEILSDFFKTYRHGSKHSVKLVHESDNKYDQNAVAVHLNVNGTDYKQVGYISKNDNQAVLAALNAGKIKGASLLSIGPNYRGDLGLTIEADMED